MRSAFSQLTKHGFSTKVWKNEKNPLSKFIVKRALKLLQRYIFKVNTNGGVLGPQVY